eukprot:2095853-Prymnesium_polylepis.1
MSANAPGRLVMSSVSPCTLFSRSSDIARVKELRTGGTRWVRTRPPEASCLPRQVASRGSFFVKPSFPRQKASSRGRGALALILLSAAPAAARATRELRPPRAAAWPRWRRVASRTYSSTGR